MGGSWRTSQSYVYVRERLREMGLFRLKEGVRAAACLQPFHGNAEQVFLRDALWKDVRQEHKFHYRKFRFEFLKFFTEKMVKNQHRWWNHYPWNSSHLLQTRPSAASFSFGKGFSLSRALDQTLPEIPSNLSDPLGTLSPGED